MVKKGTAIVERSLGNSYTIRDQKSEERFESGIRGRIRLKGVRTTNPVAVGDIVDYELDEEGKLAVITNIHQRDNYIIRRASNLSRESHIIASNIDQAAVVVTLYMPITNPEFIDRFLVTCEAYRVPAVIILNKIDIAKKVPEAMEEFREIYRLAGYRVIEVSATTGENIDELRDFIDGKTTLLAGNSGVGKSTLINTIHPEVNIRTSEISENHLTGRHTTTYAQMHALPTGGYIIDTPGLRGFGLLEIESEELYHFFPEMMRHSKDCRFYNCTHLHEPECAVLKAVEQGLIADSRYVSYVRMLEGDEKHR